MEIEHLAAEGRVVQALAYFVYYTAYLGIFHRCIYY